MQNVKCKMQNGQRRSGRWVCHFAFHILHSTFRILYSASCLLRSVLNPEPRTLNPPAVPRPTASTARILKRAIDLLVSTVLLVLGAPVLGVAAAMVRIAMGPPVLFRQVRAGYRGRPFTLFKFRTMRQLAGADGKPLPDSLRLTPLGRLLRSTSIDELPQLLNVLQGDMSLVGPRPLLMQYLDRYTPEQARRHEVKPGMTGWAQVHGRNAIGWEEKFALDVWYVDHWSLRLDAWIVWLTAWGMVRRTGINHAADATMPEFTGSPVLRQLLSPGVATPGRGGTFRDGG